MKTQVIKTELAIDIVHQYWNQLGETISREARDYLEEQIGMCSIEVDLSEEE